MAQKNNFILKVVDAGAPIVKKALTQAGITVESIVQVHKEVIEAKEDKEAIKPIIKK